MKEKVAQKKAKMTISEWINKYVRLPLMDGWTKNTSKTPNYKNMTEGKLNIIKNKPLNISSTPFNRSWLIVVEIIK